MPNLFDALGDALPLNQGQADVEGGDWGEREGRLREHDLLEELHAWGSWSNGRQNVLVGGVEHWAVEDESIEGEVSQASPIVPTLILVVVYFWGNPSQMNGLECWLALFGLGMGLLGGHLERGRGFGRVLKGLGVQI